MHVVEIRRERREDFPAVDEVVSAAFADETETSPAEVRLVRNLRADPAYFPALALVAVADGVVVGHVMCTRAHVDERPALGLAPLSVRPDAQRRRIGSTLVSAVLAAADAIDEPLVGVLGDPAYYVRFGFRPAADFGISPSEPRWGAHFQCRGLTRYSEEIRGSFRYAPPFGRL